MVTRWLASTRGVNLAVRTATTLLLAAPVYPVALHAQNFPTQPLRLIVPYAPGGATDVIARPLANGLGEALGQNVLIDHRPGANTIIGAEATARAQPDGHTLLLATVSTLGVNPTAYKNIPYDVVKDFEPIAKVASSYHVIVARKGLPANSVKELIALARAQPGTVSYGTTGVGSSLHFAILLLESATGVKMLHVPYKGSAPVVTALLGEQIDISPIGPASAAGTIRDGRLKALAATSEKRFSAYPDVPTMIELGFPNFTTGAWYCIVTRSGLPVATAERLNRESNRVLQQPALRKALDAEGVTLEGNLTRAELGKFIVSEMRKWEKIIRDANIQLE